ncbi:hypothetical protein DFJ73DRAFT_858600 [Zopfochytrium polystomum]|nr:hypothetical protein DFJ73DRAFT_858600 [Zopfochytrium polystomum]
MIVAIVLQTENGLLNGFLTLKVSRDLTLSPTSKFSVNLGPLTSVDPLSPKTKDLNNFRMILLTVHATYRALLASGVRPVVLHAISASIFAASTILHTLVFNGVVMVFFFSLSQITIICTMSRVYKTSVSSAIVAKMLIRCVLYALLSVAFIMLASM